MTPLCVQQWFSMHQDHLEDILEHRFVPPPKKKTHNSSSTGLRWGSIIRTSPKECESLRKQGKYLLRAELGAEEQSTRDKEGSGEKRKKGVPEVKGQPGQGRVHRKGAG